MQHTITPEDHGPFGAPMERAVRACVHCGFCLAACPTYQELGEELHSPRGRIILMKEVLEGNLTADEAQPYLDPCLGCLACEPACPSGVPYRDLISPFRALTNRERKRPLIDRLKRFLIEQTLPFPKRFRLAAQTGRLAKPLKALAPKALQPMIDLIPDRLPPQQSIPVISPAIGETRYRVALLAGCAQQVLDPDINAATIEVLNRNGVEVVTPPNQSCCGALSWHVGNLTQAQKYARQNLKAFPQNIDAILTNAAGCGSGLQEMPLILRGTDDEDDAKDFSQRVMDISVFLNRLGNLAFTKHKEYPALRIAYHDACHLANAQGVRSEPRQLLAQIPGAEILEIPDAHLCCGSAGTYNIDQPAVAHALGQQKAQNIVDLKPDIIASGNIGCLTQLKLHLDQLGYAIPIRHTIQVLRDFKSLSDL